MRMMNVSTADYAEAEAVAIDEVVDAVSEAVAEASPEAVEEATIVEGKKEEVVA